MFYVINQTSDRWFVANGISCSRCQVVRKSLHLMVSLFSFIFFVCFIHVPYDRYGFKGFFEGDTSQKQERRGGFVVHDFGTVFCNL